MILFFRLSAIVEYVLFTVGVSESPFQLHYTIPIFKQSMAMTNKTEKRNDKYKVLSIINTEILKALKKSPE